MLILLPWLKNAHLTTHLVGRENENRTILEYDATSEVE